MRGIMTKNKFLIINADDFGMSREFNLAIRDLMNNQSVTTTSIMANGLAFSEAVSFINQLRSYNPYWKNRVHEYNLFMEYDKAKLQNEFGIELISYRDILEIL